MINGFYDIMDTGMADALGVDIETYITVIEDRCTAEEAKLIFEGIWFEEDWEGAKQLFNSKL